MRLRWRTPSASEGGAPSIVVAEPERLPDPSGSYAARREIAKLVGAAPLGRDSGTLRGRRFVQGGRAGVRAVHCMAALVASERNAVIRTFCLRLLAAGKPKRLAVVACMRKLLTILDTMARTGERWSADHAHRVLTPA